MRYFAIVWRMLHGVGEPMLRDEATYTYEGIIGFRKGQNGWRSIIASPNITYKEFMKIMKPKDKKEEERQYIDNLLDYLDKPELIQHVAYGEVKALFHFPYNHVDRRITAVFENGESDCFNVNGKSEYCRETRRFFLKPKENKYFEGWRRAVRTSDGRIFTDNVACPTKKEFMEGWDRHNSRFGPWERVKFEVSDD